MKWAVRFLSQRKVFTAKDCIEANKIATLIAGEETILSLVTIPA